MLYDMVLQGKTDSVKLLVLVIGHEPTFLANVSEFLHLLNHQVWTYTNPFTAFSALRVRRNVYDLIITDLYLPDMDGFEVQKRVRQEFKLPDIVISSEELSHCRLFTSVDASKAQIHTYNLVYGRTSAEYRSFRLNGGNLIQKDSNKVKACDDSSRGEYATFGKFPQGTFTGICFGFVV